MKKPECWVCNGTKPVAFTHKCIEHDICDVCKSKKEDIEGIPWGTRTGFICDKCQQAKWAKRIAAFTDKDFKNASFTYRDDIKCPYCGYEYQPDELYEDEERDCPNCNSCIEIEVDWAANFSISKSKT